MAQWWRNKSPEDSHNILRTQVCRCVCSQCSEWKNNIIDWEFKEKPRGVNDFDYRQKKDSQFTDTTGCLCNSYVLLDARKRLLWGDRIWVG